MMDTLQPLDVMRHFCISYNPFFNYRIEASRLLTDKTCFMMGENLISTDLMILFLSFLNHFFVRRRSLFTE